MVELGKRTNVPVVEDLGSGVLVNLQIRQYFHLN